MPPTSDIVEQESGDYEVTFQLEGEDKKFENVASVVYEEPGKIEDILVEEGITSVTVPDGYTFSTSVEEKETGKILEVKVVPLL